MDGELKKYYELGPFTVFDLETTGFSPANDRIVEIAALRIDTDGFVRRFHTLVNPGRPIPPQTSKVHHIDDEMVANAPHFAQIGLQFLSFAAKSTLVAHNARFDLGFLQESLNRTGLPLWQGKTLDSLVLIRRAYNNLPSYKMQDLRAVFKLDERLPDMAAHRAASDVEWTHEILKISLEELLRHTLIR